MSSDQTPSEYAQPPMDAHSADDLVPRAGSGAVSPFDYGSRSLNAMLATKQRNGSWVVPAYLAINSVMGEVKLDMREATFESREIRIQLNCVMAGLKLWVPLGTQIVDDTHGALSDVKLKKMGAEHPQGLRIIISGLLFMSSITVYGSEHVTLSDRIKGNF